MQRFIVGLCALLIGWLWFSFAANPSIINYSYEVDGDDVNIFRTDNSNWGKVDINVQNPDTNERLNFGTANISDQMFVYTKQRNWDQKIWMSPDDWWDEVYINIQWVTTLAANVNRTVIPAVPKTWPSGNIVWIILATIAIFGGYIYIKKRADI